jgi:hypothetical protein
MEAVPRGGVDPLEHTIKRVLMFNTQLSVSQDYQRNELGVDRVYTDGVITGKHYPMISYSQFVSDGGYIGDDGFLYVGTGHEILEYLYTTNNSLHEMEMSCIERNVNADEVPIMAYARPEDFVKSYYATFDIIVCEGSGVPIAISPSLSYGDNNVYDWNNKWGGTTPELRETIKNTRTNKELALCSNINVATTATSYNLSESYRNYNMLNISVKTYNNVLSTQMVTTDYFYNTGSGGRPIIPVFTANGSFLGSVEVYKNTDTSVYVKVSSGNTLTANHRLQIVGIDKK